MKTFVAAVAATLSLAAAAQAQTPKPDETAFRALYKELVETNTTLSSGSCTLAAERMAARLKAAGFQDSDLTLFTDPACPRTAAWSPSCRAAIPRPRRSCCWRTSTWSRPTGTTGPAIPSP